MPFVALYVAELLLHPKLTVRALDRGDAELGLVYYLFHAHGILPGDYYRRTQGEKDLLWALSSYEADAAVKNHGARTGHRRKK